MGCFGGGGSSNKEGQAANELQREQMEKQHEYETKVYDFNWEGSKADPKGQMWKNFNHQVEGLEIAKANNKASRDYQQETQQQQYDYGVEQQDYQHFQQERIFRKSEDQYGQQRAFNEAEMQAALDREKDVLDEQFIESAFQNQSLIQDLYENVGGAGYDKAAQMLGLKGAEGELEFQKTQQLVKLKQDVEGARFQQAGKQLSLVDASGQTDYKKANIAQDLAEKEAINKFKKVELTLSQGAAKTRADFENDLIRREISDSKAKAAYDTTNANVKALQQLGTAATLQSGRSQGKAVQMVLAELGRQQAWTVESMIRGESTARARMKNNRVTALNTQAQAGIKKAQVDYDTLSNIERADRDTKEAERDLSITGSQGKLDLDEIRKQVMDASESTDISVKEVNRNLKQKQSDTGLAVKKIDWETANVGSRFKHNQDVLRASLDSAVKASQSAKGDIVRSKYQADLQADARRMLEPERQPDMPEPLDIPETKYQDPLDPAAPPKPIKGAMARDVKSGGGFANIASSVVGGAVAGTSIFAAQGGFAAGASVNPALAIAVGLGTMLFG